MALCQFYKKVPISSAELKFMPERSPQSCNLQEITSE